jgi:hypothetical protein
MTWFISVTVVYYSEGSLWVDNQQQGQGKWFSPSNCPPHYRVTVVVKYTTGIMSNPQFRGIWGAGEIFTVSLSRQGFSIQTRNVFKEHGCSHMTFFSLHVTT